MELPRRPRSGRREHRLRPGLLRRPRSELGGRGPGHRAAGDLFVDLDATVEVRNEARDHLWYEAKFGVPCAPFASTEEAICSFPNTSSCLGVRPGADGLVVFAPYGFADLFALRARPNPVLAPRAVYEAKTARWRTEWPRLTVLPWPDSDSDPA